MKDPAPAPTTALTPAIFLALSCGLTGVSAARLQSAAESIDFSRLFHAAVVESIPAPALEKLTNTFLAASTVTEGAADILIDPVLGPLGRSIIRLWRTGAWHDPAAPMAPPKPVCDQTYRLSAVWHAVQAHPAHRLLFAAGP